MSLLNTEHCKREVEKLVDRASRLTEKQFRSVFFHSWDRLEDLEMGETPEDVKADLFMFLTGFDVEWEADNYYAKLLKDIKRFEAYNRRRR